MQLELNYRRLQKSVRKKRSVMNWQPKNQMHTYIFERFIQFGTKQSTAPERRSLIIFNDP